MCQRLCHAAVDEPHGQGELQGQEQRHENLELPVLGLVMEHAHPQQRREYYLCPNRRQRYTKYFDLRKNSVSDGWPSLTYGADGQSAEAVEGDAVAGCAAEPQDVRLVIIIDIKRPGPILADGAAIMETVIIVETGGR